MSASISQIINAMVQFATNIANDNKHGYSQSVRSLYETNATKAKSFDCSSLVLTSIQYAFEKYGITPTPKDLCCSYTGNMLNLKKCGFEIVAVNQRSSQNMKKGDIELNPVYHTAMAISSSQIVHARTSEGTKDTKDNSGNEIRVQDWYLYSHGWGYRLRFTGKGCRGILEEPKKTKIKKPPIANPTLHNGSTGTQVKYLQQDLNFILKCTLTIDGKLGKETEKQLKHFQSSYMGKDEADGIYGIKTRGTMAHLVKKA